MKLQRGLRDLGAAGATVYALSYDEADALRDFANSQGIEYTLLSDPDSEVIRAFGILNTLIDENDHPWFGIPFPVVYVMDADGTITHKFAESSLALRPSPEQLVRAVRGEAVAVEPAASESDEAVSVDVALDGDRLSVGVLRDLVVRFQVPRGQHLYAEPAPAGLTGVAIELDRNDALVVRDLQEPQRAEHQLAGTDERFDCYEGTATFRLALTANSAAAKAAELPIRGTIRWQACDATACGLPQQQRFEVTVPVSGAVTPSFVTGDPDPKDVAHFQRMIERRQKASP